MVQGMISPIFIYSFLTTFAIAILSGICLAFSMKERSRLHQRVFRHWALGYFLLIWDKVPVALAAFGVHFSEDRIALVYLVGFSFYAIAILILSRGFLLLFTDSFILLTVLPLAIIIGGIIVSLAAYLLFGSVVIGLWAVKIITYLAVAFNVGVGITLLLSKRRQISGWQVRTGLVLMIVGWLVILVTRGFVWRIVSRSPQAWFNVIISSPWIYMGFLGASLCFIAAVVFLRHHGEAPVPRDKRAISYLGLDILAVFAFGLIVTTAIYSGSLFASVDRGQIFIEKRGKIDIIVERQVSLGVYAESRTSWNAVEGRVQVPTDLDIVAISLKDSGISFWLEAPVSSPAGEIVFAGGMPRGVSGRVLLFTLITVPRMVSSDAVLIKDGSILANDGEGTLLETENKTFFYEVLPLSVLRADLNGDGRIDMKDISVVLSSWGGRGGAADLDGSGVVDLNDATFILSAFSRSSVGSRAYLP